MRVCDKGLGRESGPGLELRVGVVMSLGGGVWAEDRA
jgi:hypothetical protein